MLQVYDIVAGCFCDTAQGIGMKCLVREVEVRETMVKEAEEHVGTSYFEIVDRRCMHAFSISSQSG